MAPTSTPITIVLCTHNGAAHLEAQLQSYLDQTHRNWALWVSDDGSDDATPDILRAFQAAHGDAHDIRLLRGPCAGAAQNYLHTLCHPDLPLAHVALSDQDDVWHPDTLARALARIDALEAPLIYGAQSLHTRADLTPIRPSAPPPRPVGFANALVQNVISGHSCVLSPEALELVRATGVPQGVPYHDWWLYLLVSAAGGQVVVDDAVVLSYRQHAGNLMGGNRGPAAKIARLGMILGGAYGRWIAANMAALGAISAALSPEAQRVIAQYHASPARIGPPRRALWRDMGAYRQTGLANRVLALAAFLGRI